MNSNLMSKSYT